MTWRTSLSLRNSSEIALRITLSASDSSRSISWQILRMAGASAIEAMRPDRRLHTLSTAQQQFGELRGLGRDLLDVVQHQRFGGVLDEVEHVIHARDQAMDVVAIEGRDEGGVQQLHGLVRDAVGGVLGILDVLDADRRDPSGCRSAQHVGQGEGAVDDEFRVAVEKIEESPLARHEAGNEVHCFPPT